MTTFTVNHIRSLYASGLYHKSEIFVRFIKDLKTPDTLENILNYSSHTNIREDLQFKIFALRFIFEASDTYHKTLREAAIMEHSSMMEDPKNAPAEFGKVKSKAEIKLSDKLQFINKEFGTTFTVYDVQSRLFRD